MRNQGAKIQFEMLTELRREAKPLSAYDLLARLNQRNGKLAPTTVYRALAVLVEQGQVHRVESINAFVACQCVGHPEASVLSICDDCGSVGEHRDDALLKDLSALTERSGFSPSRCVVEVRGLCTLCSAELMS
ncbi:MAG: transcriptional repressor [Rhodospirillaceae bacterium]|nr:transcriptional repressor [Rhodospirillaceae bacterium]